MNGRTLNVVLASSFGAGIGSLVAIELFHALWLFGLLVGTVVGYLSCEWREVVAAVPVAWRAARGWKAKPSYWKSAKYTMSLGVVAGSWVATIMAVVNVALLRAIESVGIGIGYSMVPGVLAMSFLGGLAIGFLFSFLDMFVTEESLVSTVEFFGRFGVRGILSCSAPVVLLWKLPRALPSAIVATIRFVLSFGWQLFLAVFSKARLTSAAASLIGSGIGFLCGSVLAGMFSGAVLGFVGHAVILRFWLVPRGYVPAPAKIN